MTANVTTLAELLTLITQRHGELSKRLQQIAEYILENESQIAFGTVASIAKAAGVHPSALVRFANALGFGGFSEMQKLFQRNLVEEAPSYNDRIRIAKAEHSEQSEASQTLLDMFAKANGAALSHLSDSVDQAQLDAAIELLAQASNVYVMGVRRSFAVASYVNYSLRNIGVSAFLIDGVGGMYREYASSLKPGDVLFVCSFSPYASETQVVVEMAVANGARVVAVTDSPVSPLAALADSCFIVKEGEVHGFRSLSSSLCLSQALVIGLAYKLDPEHEVSE